MCSLCVSDGLKIQDNLTSRVGQCAGEHDAVTSRVAHHVPHMMGLTATLSIDKL